LKTREKFDSIQSRTGNFFGSTYIPPAAERRAQEKCLKSEFHQDLFRKIYSSPTGMIQRYLAIQRDILQTFNHDLDAILSATSHDSAQFENYGDSRHFHKPRACFPHALVPFRQ
jgi:hypothetical protein